MAGGLDIGCGEGGKNQGDAQFGAPATGRMELPSDVGKERCGKSRGLFGDCLFLTNSACGP